MSGNARKDRNNSRGKSAQPGKSAERAWMQDPRSVGRAVKTQRGDQLKTETPVRCPCLLAQSGDPACAVLPEEPLLRRPAIRECKHLTFLLCMRGFISVPKFLPHRQEGLLHKCMNKPTTEHMS